MTKIDELANDNLPKGAIRLLVIVVLIAISVIATLYFTLTKDNTKYDRQLYAECLSEIKLCREEIKMCNDQRNEEHKYYMESILKMNKEVENIKKTIKVKK